jgi:hypothetical protein
LAAKAFHFQCSNSIISPHNNVYQNPSIFAM